MIRHPCRCRAKLASARQFWKVDNLHRILVSRLYFLNRLRPDSAGRQMADELHEYEAQLKDSKFLHLLKPIRDLAENWNVDIANE